MDGRIVARREGAQVTGRRPPPPPMPKDEGVWVHGENTGKFYAIAEEEIHRLAVPRSELSGIFELLEKWVKRLKWIVGLLLAVASAGWAFGLFTQSLARRAEVELRMGAIEKEMARLTGGLDTIVKQLEDIRVSHDRGAP